MTEPAVTVDITNNSFKNELDPVEEVSYDNGINIFESVNPPLEHSFHNSTISDDSNSTVTPFAEETSTAIFNNSRRSSIISQNGIKVPIVGYEVMEERARFTVYKLRVENMSTESSWFVYRRYTDFVRLSNVLKSVCPDIATLLPRKRWFGNNFDQEFLNQRIHGLQAFINVVVGREDMLKDQHVQDFLCMNEPSLDTETFLEDSRAICEAYSETIHTLRVQLKEKNLKIVELNERLCSKELKISKLQEFVSSQIRNCKTCFTELKKDASLGAILDYTQTSTNKTETINRQADSNDNIHDFCDNINSVQISN